MEIKRIAVFGGGSGACITAADLTLRGYEVSLCEVPEMAELSGIEETKKAGGINLEDRGKSGTPEGFARLSLVTTDAEKALEAAQVVFVVVPAFAQRRFAEFVCDGLTPEQIVVLEPGNFGGSLEFAQVIKNKGMDIPLLVEFDCMIYSGRKDSPTYAWVGGFKRQLKAAAFPAKRTGEALETLTTIYPSLRPAKNVMETGLGNPNTVVHAPMMLHNAGWVEHTHGDFGLYWDGCTPSVGRVVQAVEDERLSVGKALGINLTPTKDLLLTWYGDQGAKGNTLHEVMSTNPVYGPPEKSPSSLRHRYLLEDVPYGLKPLEDLARLVGVSTPTVSAVITLAGKLLGEDFRQNARDLRRLGLAGLDAAGINKLMSEGF